MSAAPPPFCDRIAFEIHCNLSHITFCDSAAGPGSRPTLYSMSNKPDNTEEDRADEEEQQDRSLIIRLAFFSVKWQKQLTYRFGELLAANHVSQAFKGVGAGDEDASSSSSSAISGLLRLWYWPARSGRNGWQDVRQIRGMIP